MIRLILTDMDGTFLDSKGGFDHELFSRVKKEMDSQKVLFAPCTGKQCERVEELFGEESDSLWIIGDSGTRIKHNGKVIYERLLDNHTGLEIIKALTEISGEHTIIACTTNCAYVKDSIPETEMAIVRRSYASLSVVKEFEEIKDDFVKVTVHDPNLSSTATKNKMVSFNNVAYMVDSEPAWLDITMKDVHKGTTVAHLQKELGIGKAETAVFGDGMNDIELMPCGEYSFAMRNGCDELKEEAFFITKSNDENGVLETILKLLKLQQYEKIDVGKLCVLC